MENRGRNKRNLARWKELPMWDKGAISGRVTLRHLKYCFVLKVLVSWDSCCHESLT